MNEITFTPQFSVGDEVVRVAEPDGPVGRITDLSRRAGRAQVSFTGLAPIWVKLDGLAPRSVAALCACALHGDHAGHADCGCPYVDHTAGVDHTKECIERQRQEGRAREVAAGLRQLADFIAANPHLTEIAPHTVLAGSVGAFVISNPREHIETFIAAARAAGIPLAELAHGEQAGVTAQLGALQLEVYTYRDYLAEQPKPPAPKYRPLLAPADEPQAGA
jgi:hypothetical protein